MITVKQQQEIRDTYKWHINECERMLWGLKSGSMEAAKLVEAVDILYGCLDVFCEGLEKESCHACGSQDCKGDCVDLKVESALDAESDREIYG